MYSVAEYLNNLLESREEGERQNMTEDDLLSFKLGARTAENRDDQRKEERK